MSAARGQMSPGPVGILAGGGKLPLIVADAAEREGRGAHIVGLRGEAGDEIERRSHTWVAWGEVGKILKALEANACRELVIAGTVSRPDLKSVRFDLGAIRNLPLLLSLTVGGDDAVLGAVVRFFEAKGLTVRGAHEIAPDLVAGTGPVGRIRPSEEAQVDIAKGVEVVRALGTLDVGQSAVVARGYVLAVEAAEGTDEMITRAGGLRQWGARGRKKAGVLVKMAKPGQELRVDMPVIGPRTVESAIAAGLAGIAVGTGSVMLIDRAEIARMADAAGLFVVGVDPGP